MDTTHTYKILMFMKRKPGLPVAEFRHYYEHHHVPLCLKYVSGISRYLRRFINPQPHPETGEWEAPEFDVITELWFDDEATFSATLQYITTHRMPQEIVEDEMKLFDRGSFRLATVTEAESNF